VKKLSALQSAQLDEVEHELRVVAGTTKGRRAFDGFRWDLATQLSCANLYELAQNLRCGPEGECRSLGFYWLLMNYHESQELTLVALVALRPALERLLSLIDPSGRDEDVVADLLAAFAGLPVIEEIDVPAFLADLQRVGRRGIRHRAVFRAHDIVNDSDVDLNVGELPKELGIDAEALIDTLLRNGVLSCDDAEVLLRSHISGESLRDLARERHVPYKTLQSQRLRCEKALRGHLRREGLVE